MMRTFDSTSAMESAASPQFIIRLGNGRYMTECRVTADVLEYDSSVVREDASHLNDFDSQMVLKRLKIKGHIATRHKA